MVHYCAMTSAATPPALDSEHWRPQQRVTVNAHSLHRGRYEKSIHEHVSQSGQPGRQSGCRDRQGAGDRRRQARGVEERVGDDQGLDRRDVPAGGAKEKETPCVEMIAVAQSALSQAKSHVAQTWLFYHPSGPALLRHPA